VMCMCRERPSSLGVYPNPRVGMQMQCRAVQNKRQNPARGASLRRSRAAGQCKDGVMWTAPRTCMHACPRRSMAWWLSCGDASNARNILRLIRPASASARTRARYQVQLLPCKHWRRRRPDEMDRASTSSSAGRPATGQQAQDVGDSLQAARLRRTYYYAPAAGWWPGRAPPHHPAGRQ